MFVKTFKLNYDQVSKLDILLDRLKSYFFKIFSYMQVGKLKFKEFKLKIKIKTECNKVIIVNKNLIIRLHIKLFKFY